MHRAGLPVELMIAHDLPAFRPKTRIAKFYSNQNKQDFHYRFRAGCSLVDFIRAENKTLQSCLEEVHCLALGASCFILIN